MNPLSLKASVSVLLLIPAVLAGQVTLHGSVADSSTNERLVGAIVVLRGMAVGGVTDREGNFRIPKIPTGSHVIRVSYVGYKFKEFDVNVAAQDIALNVQLTPEFIQGEDVVITAQARGQIAAINQQITSNTIVNVISEEKIKELPDANAAEAIGRLPGVSIIRSGGEANKVIFARDGRKIHIHHH